MLKTPNKTYQISYYDPPRLSAGCSGISMSLGGFGMLSDAEFKTMVRNIMQSAASYLMELAISAMCTSCATVMQHLHDLATKVNGMMMNSCRTGEAITATALSGAGVTDLLPPNAKTQVESQAAAAKGAYSTLWSSLTNLFSSGPTANRAQYEKESTNYGNTLFNTYYNTGAINKLDTTIFGSEELTMEILQSLIGTEIIKTSNQQVTSSNTDGSMQNKPDRSYDSVLTFNDLVNGAGGAMGTGNKYYYQCQSSGSGFSSGDPLSCQDIAPVAYTYSGIKNYLLMKFGGVTDIDVNGNPSTILDLDSVASNSIIGKMRAGTPLTSDEQGLVGSMPISLQRIFTLLQNTNNSTASVLLDEAFQVFAEQLAATQVMSLVGATQAAYSSKLQNIKVSPMTSSQTKSLSKLQADAQRHLNSQQTLQKIEQMAQHLITSRALSGGAV